MESLPNQLQQRVLAYVGVPKTNIQIVFENFESTFLRLEPHFYYKFYKLQQRFNSTLRNKYCTYWNAQPDSYGQPESYSKVVMHRDELTSSPEYYDYCSSGEEEEPKCQGTKKNGKPCTYNATAGQWCKRHIPKDIIVKPKCQASKKNGQPCTYTATADQWCKRHTPK